jgi:flagellar biosynthesis/type III secretory pathway protein FliH
MTNSAESVNRGRVVPDSEARVEPLYRPARLLKTGDLETERLLARAKEELASAEAEKEKILADARARAEEYRQEGLQTGVREGAAEFLKMLQSVDASIEGLRGTFAIEVQRCALRFAKAVLDVEFHIRPERIVDLVSNVLERAKQHQSVVVHLHPDNVQIVRREAKRLQEQLVFASRIEFRPDAELSRTGVCVETEMGLYDGSSDSQFERLEERLGGDSDRSAS